MTDAMDRRRWIAGMATLALAAAVAHPSAAWAAAEEPAPAGDAVSRAVVDIVIANRILANQGVVDAYGHVSRRHPLRPDRFLLSRSRSPELVEVDDVQEYALDGTPVGAPGGHPYLERFIHAGIYRARADVQAVAHAHAEEVLPYTLVAAPLIPVIQNAGVLGATIPVWDIRRKFGDTNLLVTDLPKGDDLARTLGRNRVVLMRGHGFAAGARSLIELLRMCIYLKEDARVLSEARRLGAVVPLSPGEIAKISDVAPGAPELQRAWEYWASKAGVASLVARGASGS
jgi:ribulose-5-phosphate 4-epimerase/fuculose-1-phosphate aldolase